MDNLTPEQLEVAARKLCELRGINPKSSDWLNPNICALTGCTQEIEKHWNLQTAIAFALGQGDGTECNHPEQDVTTYLESEIGSNE